VIVSAGSVVGKGKRVKQYRKSELSISLFRAVCVVWGMFGL